MKDSSETYSFNMRENTDGVQEEIGDTDFDVSENNEGLIESEKKESQPPVEKSAEAVIEKLTSEQIIAQARQELYPQIDQLAQEIDALAETLSTTEEEAVPLSTARFNIKEALYTWLMADNNTLKKVEDIFDDSSSPEDFARKLQDYRKGLGFFSHANKQRIDGVTYKLENYMAPRSHNESYAEQWRLAIKQDDRDKLFDNQVSSLSNRYELIMLKALEIDDKLSQLQGAANVSINLPQELESRLQKFLSDKQSYSTKILQKIKNISLTQNK